MKFLLISYSEIDGVGQHVISLNSNLIKMGHQSKTLLLHNVYKVYTSWRKSFEACFMFQKIFGTYYQHAISCF